MTSESSGVLADQVAIITGAGGGIGRAISHVFAEAGGVVVVADRDAAAAEQVAAEVVSRGGKAVAQPTDITDPAQVARLVEATVLAFGQVDVLVNNAGLSQVGTLLEVALEEWRQVFAVNVEGPLLALQQVLPQMLSQAPHQVSGCRGKVINVSSSAAGHGRPVLPAYGASKAALNHLSSTTSLAYAEHLIATTVLYPGNVKEGMWRDLAPRLAAAEGRSVAEVLVERWFQGPEEVAKAALFVAASVGMGLNGQIVNSSPQVSPL